MINYKRPTTIGSLARYVYFVVAMENTTNTWYHVFHK